MYFNLVTSFIKKKTPRTPLELFQYALTLVASPSTTCSWRVARSSHLRCCQVAVAAEAAVAAKLAGSGAIAAALKEPVLVWPETMGTKG